MKQRRKKPGVRVAPERSTLTIEVSQYHQVRKLAKEATPEVSVTKMGKHLLDLGMQVYAQNNAH